MCLKEGATLLRVPLKKIIELTIYTNTGRYEMASAKFSKEEEVNFVKKYIIINAKKFPITGNNDDNSTFWNAANTDAITLKII